MSALHFLYKAPVPFPHLFCVISKANWYYTDTEGRVRCRKCQKLVFGDGESAQAAAVNATDRGTYLRAYCENRCDNWHLSSQTQR